MPSTRPFSLPAITLPSVRGKARPTISTSRLTAQKTKTLLGIIPNRAPRPLRSKAASPSGKASASAPQSLVPSRCSCASNRCISTARWKPSAISSFPQLVLEHRPVVHHEVHVLQFRHFFQRIAGNRDDIRVRSRRHHSDLAFHVQQFARARRRRLNRVHWRHSETHQAFELLRQRFRPRNPAHVRFVHDFQMRRERFLEGNLMHRRARPVALPRRRVRIRPVVVVRRKRRAIPRSLPLHLRDLLVRDFQPMLDGIASSIQCALQSNSVVRMARHFPLPAVRFVHDRFQFFNRQRRLRHQVPLLVHPRAVRHVHLDPVRSVLQLLPRGFPRFHRPIHKLRAFGHVQFRRVIFQVVSGRRGNRPRRAEKPRPRNGPFFDRLLDFHVSVTRALRLQIAQRRESLLQRAPRRKRRSRRPQRDARFQDVDVVPALLRIFSPQKNVRVRIDQSRQHRRRREVNDFRARGDLRAAVRNSLDALAAHKNQLIFLRGIARSVNQRSCPNHRQRRGARRGTLRSQRAAPREQCAKHGQNYSFHGPPLSSARSLPQTCLPLQGSSSPHAARHSRNKSALDRAVTLNFPADSPASGCTRVRAPTASAESPRCHPRPAPRFRPSSNQSFADMTCTYRKSPRECAETLPPRIPAAFSRLLRRMPRTRFAESSTRARKTRRPCIVFRRPLPAAAPPTAAAPRTLDKLAAFRAWVAPPSAPRRTRRTAPKSPATKTVRTRSLPAPEVRRSASTRSTARSTHPPAIPLSPARLRRARSVRVSRPPRENSCSREARPSHRTLRAALQIAALVPRRRPSARSSRAGFSENSQCACRTAVFPLRKDLQR